MEKEEEKMKKSKFYQVSSATKRIAVKAKKDDKKAVKSKVWKKRRRK